MYLLISVDTEGSSFRGRPLPLEAMVHGRLDGEELGIGRIMDLCEARGIQATFFLSSLEYRARGENPLREIAQCISERGHDVQLHTHSDWSHGRRTLCELNPQEQREAIAEAQGKLTEWLGTAPIAHRAGCLSANDDTLRALADLNIKIDSSQAFGFVEDRLAGGQSPRNAPYVAHGVLEIPVTSFKQIGVGAWSLYRTLDINADSLWEIKHVLREGQRRGLPAAVLLMHSFSFVRRSADRTKFRPNWQDLRRFERLLDWVVRQPGIEPVTCGNLWARHEQTPDVLLAGVDVMSRTGIARTYCRAWERLHMGWRNQAAAFAPAGAVCAGAAYWLWRQF